MTSIPNQVETMHGTSTKLRHGGQYIPPGKLALLQSKIKDKSSPEYQRLSWEALKKSINGLVNRVNVSNIENIIIQLFGENLIRGRGLFVRSCMRAQEASRMFTPVYAALLAAINSKIPSIGRLIASRLILQFRRSLKRGDKNLCLAATVFIAHLVNQSVVNVILVLEIAVHLLQNPTEDSVEIAVALIRECGHFIGMKTPKQSNMIFERFRGILQEGEIDKRVQYMIEVLFVVRKDKFKDNPTVPEGLDIVFEEDQISHVLTLDDTDLQIEQNIDVFSIDDRFLENEEEYAKIKAEIMGDDAESGVDPEEEIDENILQNEAEKGTLQIQDETHTDILNLRKTIYLTIMSTLNFEEGVHKLMKIKLQDGQEVELCNMILDCCRQERTYMPYYGLVASRFCEINRAFSDFFGECFVESYRTIHRFETNHIRNMAKFFGHLLSTDAIGWQCFAVVKLTEEDTSASSRIFLKDILQELLKDLGLKKLVERFNDPIMNDFFSGLFCKDSPKNTRFCINYFTSIQMGALSVNLREWLKEMSSKTVQQLASAASSDSESDTDSDDSSESEPEEEKEKMIRRTSDGKIEYSFKPQENIVESREESRRPLHSQSKSFDSRKKRRYSTSVERTSGYHARENKRFRA